MARAMPLFCIPFITKNVFTMQHPSPISKIFSAHWDFHKSQLYEVQVLDANGNQSLLTLLGIKKHLLLPSNAIINKSMW
jgi:hypothetical protein